MAQRPNPTRINLINLRRRVSLAQKGHNILKRKREVLVIEFLRLLGKSRSDRDLLYQVLQAAYKSTVVATTFVGNFELEEMSLYMQEAQPIRIAVKNVMGVHIPEITKETKPVVANLFNLTPTSLAVDDISDSFTKVRDMVVDIAQREQGLKRLVLEIDKTKRRVNALEYIVIPEMEGHARYIRMRLSEMDRDTFSALKHVKKRLEKAGRG